MRSKLAVCSLALSGLTAVACSGAAKDSGFITTGSGNDGGASTVRADGGDDLTDGGTAPSFGDASLSDANGTTAECKPDPSNYDVPGDKCDNDGDGQVDNVIACDTGLTAAGDAMDFAKSIGLCQVATASDTKWGVISATFTNGHVSTKAPAPAQHGILGKFGNVVVPREGAMFGVLSSGSATEQDSDQGPFFKGPKDGMQGAPPLLPGLPTTQTGDAPNGYPKDSPTCSGIKINKSVNDVVNVKLVIRVPANAKGLAFDFDFWSGEWPEYVCSTFNDSFVAFLSSKAFNGGTPDNMSFDAKNNPVSVNNGFFDRCTPNSKTGCDPTASPGTAACAGGVAELAGTGFENTGSYCKGQTSTGGGATGWLTSQAPVTPGETITLELMIWDTGDASFDSSVILDNFQWQGVPTPPGTQRPPPK